MSNVRSSEPQAYGLILLKTTFGDLEVELFTQQCPKATRNFVQLCLDGYYNETMFDRVERDFIAVGGALQEDEPDDRRDKAGTFRDEFFPRLRFTRRGLMATANTQKDANGPEFFFTLGPTPELQDKNTIFGRLKGDSVYYLVDLNEIQVDDDMVPMSEQKILETHVIENPYPDLEPRKGLKRSVGIGGANKEDSGDDQDRPKFNTNKKLSFNHDDSDDEDNDDDEDYHNEEPQQADVKPPRGDTLKPTSTEPDRPIEVKHEPDDSEPEEETGNMKELKAKEETQVEEDPREKQLREIRAQIQALKRQFDSEPAETTKVMKTSERRALSNQRDVSESIDSSKHFELDPDDGTSRIIAKKGRQNERETLELLEKFKKKLKGSNGASDEAKQSTVFKTIDKDEFEANDGDLNLDDLDKVDGDAWMRHKFEAADDDDQERLAKDANTKDDDWYKIEDPRNPMMKRIEASKHERSSSRHRDDHEDRHQDRHRHDRERRDDRHRREGRDHRDRKHHDTREDLRQFSRHHHSRRA